MLKNIFTNKNAYFIVNQNIRFDLLSIFSFETFRKKHVFVSIKMKNTYSKKKKYYILFAKNCAYKKNVVILHIH